MIILDTNVVSELLRPKPNESVRAWVASHDRQLALTAISLAELLYGVRRLPQSKRRDMLAAAIARIEARYRQEILLFDREAAQHYADLRAERDSDGKPVGLEDIMIAAIARSRGHVVATRNVSHFEGYGVEVVDPWKPT